MNLWVFGASSPISSRRRSETPGAREGETKTKTRYQIDGWLLVGGLAKEEVTDEKEAKRAPIYMITGGDVAKWEKGFFAMYIRIYLQFVFWEGRSFSISERQKELL